MGGDGQPQILLQLAGPPAPQRPVARPRPSAAGAGCCAATASGFDTWTAPGGPASSSRATPRRDWVAGLARRGHDVARAVPFDSAFGHAHVIVVQADGTLAAAADPRQDRQRGRRLTARRDGAAAGAGATRRSRATSSDRAAGCTVASMRVDTNFFGTVPMPDAGDPTVAPTARRYGNDDVIACYENMLHWAADGRRARLRHDVAHRAPLPVRGLRGPAEPHPCSASHLAPPAPRQLRFGQMFNVVPQWHPLRLAEDFALADILTGGRMEFGVGRGTVPREAWALGTVVASGDNEMSAEHDRINREVFEEAMEVIKLAWTNERFSYRGKHFVFPPDDVPDRGTLRQRPHADPQARRARRHLPAGHLAGDDRVRAPRRAQGRLLAAERRQPEAEVGPLRRDPRARSARRSARARTAAWCSTSTSAAPARRRCARAGRATTSSAKFLAPYGRFSSYRFPDGSKVPFDFQPDRRGLDASSKIQVVGSIDDAVDALGF